MLNASGMPSAVVVYPDSVLTPCIVPVFARNFPAAGVWRMRYFRVPSTPAAEAPDLTPDQRGPEFDNTADRQAVRENL